MKRTRKFIESVMFAGLKPGARTAPKPRNWFGPLRTSIDRFISGSAPTDPLYLTNRTLGERITRWSLIAIPCLVVTLGVGVTLSRVLSPPARKPAKELTNSEIAARLLPNLDEQAKLAPRPDVQVLEVRVDGTRLVGTVKNMTKRDIPVTVLVINLTNSSGSHIGAVSGTVENLPASGIKDFQIPIQHHGAAFALVREVIVR